jgi:hypothetical protein
LQDVRQRVKALRRKTFKGWLILLALATPLIYAFVINGTAVTRITSGVFVLIFILLPTLSRAPKYAYTCSLDEDNLVIFYLFTDKRVSLKDIQNVQFESPKMLKSRGFQTVRPGILGLKVSGDSRPTHMRVDAVEDSVVSALEAIVERQ